MKRDKNTLEYALKSALLYKTTAAHGRIGPMSISKIGPYQVPTCSIAISCGYRDLPKVGRLAYQAVCKTLSEAGVPILVLQSPEWVLGRETENFWLRFLDVNQDSSTYGEDVEGISWQFSFTIRPAGLGYFRFNGRHGNISNELILPDSFEGREAADIKRA